jgi:hypothetical protein
MEDRGSHVVLSAMAGATSWHAATGGMLLAVAGIGVAMTGTFLVAASWLEDISGPEAMGLALLAAVISAPLQVIVWGATSRCPSWARAMGVLGAVLLGGGVPLGQAQWHRLPSRVFERGIMPSVPAGVRILRAQEGPTDGIWVHLATQPEGLRAVMMALECQRPRNGRNPNPRGAPPWWDPHSMENPTLFRYDVEGEERALLATHLVWVNEARTEAYVAVLCPAIP